MDLDAVRTFAAVADAGQFSDAAADLAVTQQAVSKRIAALERDLGVRLFTRTPRGARLTPDGQAFLPHARELLQAERRAAESVRPGRRPLRVDVLSRRLAPAALLRGFHRAHPGTELDVVIAIAVTVPARQLPDGVAAELATAFGLTIDAAAPDSGAEPLLDVLARAPALATLVGEQTRLHWPADYDLRRIPVHAPVPAYPHSLIWRRDNPHPVLAALRDHLGSRPPAHGAGTWTPRWAQPMTRR